MCLHRKALAVDEMFARMMEMELQQPIVSSRPDREHAAVVDVHLYGVAVVDDGIDVLGPCDVQRRQLRLDGLADVDWRLLAADGAGAIGGIEVAPFGRTVGAFIAPMSIGGEASRCAQGAERNPSEQFQRLTAMHGALLSADRPTSFARSMDDLSRQARRSRCSVLPSSALACARSGRLSGSATATKGGSGLADGPASAGILDSFRASAYLPASSWHSPVQSASRSPDRAYRSTT